MIQGWILGRAHKRKSDKKILHTLCLDFYNDIIVTMQVVSMGNDVAISAIASFLVKI